MRCPYESTSSRKCTHKGVAPRKMRRSRSCGYGDPEDCILYQEWDATRKACERASCGFIDMYENEGEDDIKE